VRAPHCCCPFEQVSAPDSTLASSPVVPPSKVEYPADFELPHPPTGAASATSAKRPSDQPLTAAERTLRILS